MFTQTDHSQPNEKIFCDRGLLTSLQSWYKVNSVRNYSSAFCNKLNHFRFSAENVSAAAEHAYSVQAHKYQFMLIKIAHKMYNIKYVALQSIAVSMKHVSVKLIRGRIRSMMTTSTTIVMLMLMWCVHNKSQFMHIKVNHSILQAAQ